LQEIDRITSERRAKRLCDSIIRSVGGFYKTKTLPVGRVLS